MKKNIVYQSTASFLRFLDKKSNNKKNNDIDANKEYNKKDKEIEIDLNFNYNNKELAY